MSLEHETDHKGNAVDLLPGQFESAADLAKLIEALVGDSLLIANPLDVLVIPEEYLTGNDDGNVNASSVAIQSSRKQVIFGHDYKRHDFGGGEVACGAVYVVDFDTGEFLQEILPSNVAEQTAGAGFGVAVAVSGDWLIIGCPYAGSGVVYILEWDGTQYGSPQRLTGSTSAAGDKFGYSVAINGSVAAVGAPYDDDNGSNSGTVFVLSKSGGTWTESQTIAAPAAQSSQFFGQAVDIDATHLAVGAHQFNGTYTDEGRVWVYTKSGGAYGSAAALTPGDHGEASIYFGASLSLNGEWLAVSAYNWDGGTTPTARGAVIVFKKTTSWIESQFIECPLAELGKDAGWYQRFGHDTTHHGGVRLAGDYLIGGSYGWTDQEKEADAPSGAAFVFKRDADGIYQLMTIGDGESYAPIYPGTDSGKFGGTVAIDADGRIAVGADSEYGTTPEGVESLTGTYRTYELKRVAHAIQELEEVLWDLYSLRWLSVATDAALDNLGDVLGEPRTVDDNEEHRDALYLKVLINVSQGEPERLIEVMLKVSGASEVHLIDRQVATVLLYAHGMTKWKWLYRVPNVSLGGVKTVVTGSESDTPFVFGVDRDAAGDGHGSELAYGDGWGETGSGNEDEGGNIVELFVQE